MNPLDALVSNASTQLATNASRRQASRRRVTRVPVIPAASTTTVYKSNASPAAAKYASAKEAAIPTAKPATPSAKASPLTMEDMIGSANLTPDEKRAVAIAKKNVELAKKGRVMGLSPELSKLLASANTKVFNAMKDAYRAAGGKGGGGGRGGSGRGGNKNGRREVNPIVSKPAPGSSRDNKGYKPIMGFDDLKKQAGSKTPDSKSKSVSDFLNGPPLYASDATRNPPKQPPGPRKQVHAWGDKTKPLGNAWGSDEHGNARFYGSGPGGGRTHDEMLAEAGSAAASQTGVRL